jgi:cytoskeletal protein CcmA (bactofilin family)
MKRTRRNTLNGFLDAGSSIHGEVRFDDTFRVEGTLTGTVTSSGNLVVGENGRVDAEIDVGSAFVTGTVRGSIRARERIELTSGARVFADLETPALMVEKGALFHGHCTMPAGETDSVDDHPHAHAVVTRLPVERKG